MIGNKFGRLTIIDSADRASNGKLRWLCRCDCGNEKIIRWSNLKNGTTQSCGCLMIERVKQSNTRHGGYDSVEYHSWRQMMQRCYDRGCKDYPRYGGRGITVCEEWKRSFASFLASVGKKPSPNLTIERSDNNGNYQPGNVRWATVADQNKNRSCTLIISVSGPSKTLAELAKLYGVKYITAWQRYRKGWSFNRIFGIKEVA